MILSKIIISITIFAVEYFRSSESLHILNCTTDDTFFKAVEQYKQAPFVLIVVTNDPNSYTDVLLKHYFIMRDYKILIRVNVGPDRCPITKEFFGVQNDFPYLYVMMKNVLCFHSWNPVASGLNINAIDDFLLRAPKIKHNNPASPYRSVALTIGDRISQRNRAEMSQQPMPRNQMEGQSRSPPLQEMQPARLTEFMFIPLTRQTSPDVPQSSTQRGKRFKSTSPEYDRPPGKIIRTQAQTQQVLHNPPNENWGSFLYLGFSPVENKKSPPPP